MRISSSGQVSGEEVVVDAVHQVPADGGRLQQHSAKLVFILPLEPSGTPTRALGPWPQIANFVLRTLVHTV